MKRKLLSVLITVFTLCTCMFTLTACGENEPPHTHVYDQQVINDTFKASHATCENKATYYYSCSCGGKGTEVFENGSMLGHAYKAWVSIGNGQHKGTCANDNSHTITRNCSGGTATCTKKAICKDCATEYGEKKSHSYTKLKQSSTQHWLECSCGAYETKENHKPGLEATETTGQKCTECGYVITPAIGHVHTLHLTKVKAKVQSCSATGNIEYYTCVCGKWFTNDTATTEINDKSSVVIAKDAHDYKTLKKTDTEHWWECSCNDKNGFEEHHGGNATCTKKAVCEDCGTEYGNYAEHSPKTTWVITDTHHYLECIYGCNETLNYGEHSFDSDNKCEVCDYVTTVLVGTEISSDVYEINGTNLFVKIPNNQTSFSFANTINVAKGASYKVYIHSSCQEHYSIPSYMVNNLNEGDHTYYFLVSNGTEIPQVYTVTVRRRPMHKVYLSSGTYQTVSNRLIEEDQYVTNLPNITRTGYDFAGWDYNGEPITKTTYIDALWTVKEDWSNFNFTVEWDSTNYCEKVIINGIKDKTVTEITIPEGVTVIDSYAFKNCNLLERVVVPSSVTDIYNYAFNNCRLINEVDFLGNINQWCSIKFCRNETLINAQSPLETNPISNGADFMLNGVLAIDVYINENIDFDYYSLQGCKTIKTVRIGKQVTDVYLDKCYGLEAITVDAENTIYSSYNNALYSYDKTSLICVPYKFYGKVDVHFNTVSVGASFVDRKFVTEIVFGKNLKHFSSNYFVNCCALTSFSVADDNPYFYTDCGILYNKETSDILCIPQSISGFINISNVDEYGLSGRQNLTTVIVEGSIGAYAFSGCSSLEIVVISSISTTVHSTAFYGCNAKIFVKKGYYHYNENQNQIYHTNAYMFSETKPTSSGNYWHYVDGIPTPW